MSENKEHTKNAKNVRRVYLKDAKDSRRYICRLINELYSDKLSPEKARALATLLNSFNKSYELSEIENRLTVLEKELNAKS